MTCQWHKKLWVSQIMSIEMPQKQNILTPEIHIPSKGSKKMPRNGRVQHQWRNASGYTIKLVTSLSPDGTRILGPKYHGANWQHAQLLPRLTAVPYLNGAQNGLGSISKRNGHRDTQASGKHKSDAIKYKSGFTWSVSTDSWCAEDPLQRKVHQHWQIQRACL